jgi:hypothetical protein
MKRLLFFCLLAFSSQAQLLNTYYPVYESNRKKGNGKLYYRLYSLNSSIVFPNTEAEFDNTYTTYGTFQTQGTTNLAVVAGSLNSSSSSSRNILYFASTTDFTSSINNTTPYAGFTGERYALMISGYFIPKQTGTYKFSIEGDDSVEIMINGTNVANHYGGHGASAIGTHTGSISLVAGKSTAFAFDLWKMVPEIPCFCFSKNQVRLAERLGIKTSKNSVVKKSYLMD